MDFQNGLKFLDRFRQVLFLRIARALIAQCPNVNSREQPVRVNVIWIQLQHRASLFHRLAQLLRFSARFREPFHNHRGIRREGERLLVRLNCAYRQFRLPSRLVLLLVEMPDREVVISIATRRIIRGR